MIRSLRANAALLSTIPAQVIAADDTINGTAVTWGDCQSAMAVVVTGTITDGTHTVELQHSDDNSSWAAVPTSQLAGTEPALDDGDSDTITELGYLGTKKYLRVSITSADTTSGGLIGAYILKAYPSQGPLR